MMKHPRAALLLFVFFLSGVPAGAAINQATARKLLSDDNAFGDNFGYAVSVDGGTAVIGAPYDDNHGSAYVFVRTPEGAWRQQAKLSAGDSATDDRFGLVVSVDGDTAVIGSPGNDGIGMDSGAAYVFVRTPDGTWNQEAKLTARDARDDDNFGSAVSLDDDTAVIGAKRCDPVTGACTGSAYVFARSVAGAWGQMTKLAAAGGSSEANFGRSVSVSGNIALVGSEGYYDDKGSHPGAAYVFVRSGGAWSQEARLFTSDGNEKDSFGCSVSLDEKTALVGTTFAGTTYVFVRAPDGTWSQEATLTSRDSAAENYFSSSVSVSGGTALIGMVHGSESDDYSSGVAYVFSRSPDGRWSQQSRLAAPFFNYFGYFGYSVSLDGDTALVGSWGDADNGSWSGSAYVFTGKRANLSSFLQLLLK